MNSFLDLLHLAARAAEAAGAYIRGSEGSPAWVQKGHNDWVTEVDRGAEALIRDILIGGAPGSRVMGEELAPEIGNEGMVWIVDPLDGTTNFLHGYPQYAVSIALAVEGELAVGVVLDVNRECVYGAVRGGGAWLGNTALRVSAIADPGALPARHRISLQAPRGARHLSGAIPPHSSRHEWCAARRLRRDRPRRRCRGPAGRVLGTDAGTVGHRRGHPADP
jgi:fructose-1,6-bisphosphatase/inositol monophosphatase family enzyme